MSYTGNSNSMVVHEDGCPCMDEMDPDNAEPFAELWMAVGMGYVECKVCIGPLYETEEKAA